MHQRTGLAHDALRVFWVDGKSIFAAGHGIAVVLVHQLHASQCFPVSGGVGVSVYQLVENPFRVFELTQSEQRASHQFLEVAAVVALAPHHPFVGLVVDAVVYVQVGAVFDEVLIFVSVYRHFVVAQIAVGLIDVPFCYHDLCLQIVVVRVVVIGYPVGIFASLFEVVAHQGLSRHENVGQRGVRIQLKRIINNVQRLVFLAVLIVVIGNVYKVVSIHEGLFASLHGCLVTIQ